MNAAQNSALIAPFCSEEILQAIKSLGKNKALGPDRFIVEFFFIEFDRI